MRTGDLLEARRREESKMISPLTMLLRLALALLFGAVIGFERESREHAAGMRTNALVALGSCLFTLISAYGFLDFTRLNHIQIDPTRIASYVVAGIGFLGAGSIFLSQRSNTVKGLTTAAAVWLVAAIGMACGGGLLLIAGMTTALGLIVLIFMQPLERLLLPKQAAKAASTQVRIEALHPGTRFVSQVSKTLTEAGIQVEGLEVHKEQERDIVQITCRVHDPATLVQIIDQLRALPEVSALATGKPEAAIERPSSR